MDKLIRFAFALLSWAIILFALATIGLRIGLSNIDTFKTEIEGWLAKDVIPGTSFAGLQGEWNQFNPVLRLTSVSITTPDKSQALVIDELVVEFDYFRSLWYWSPVVSDVTAALAKLSVKKDSEQRWWLNDIPLSFTSSDQTVSSFEELVAQMPYYIQLRLDQLEIDDQFSKRKYRITQVRADLQQLEESIHLQLSAILPDALGNRVNINSIFKQDNSVIYLKSDSLELSRIADLIGIDPGNLQSAELGGEVWINLLENRSPVLNGKISISRGLWKTGSENDPLPFALSARVNASRIGNWWNLGGYIESLSFNNQALSGFNTQLRLISGNDRSLVQGWLDDFELQNMVLLRQQFLPAEIGNLVQQSQLQGRIKDAWFSFDPADIKNIELSARIEDFSSRAVDAIPGVEKINASFTLGGKNAMLQLDAEQMAIDFSDRFRAPFEIDRLQVQAYTSLVDDGLVVSVPRFEVANTDIRLVGRMRMETDRAGAPFLYLRAQFEDGKGSSNGKYLPLKLLPEKVVAWLDQGIRKIEISAGELLFHGRTDGIKSFSERNAGEMFVDFDIDNAEILFDPKWAPARQAKGRVMFHNAGMEIELEQVKFGEIDSGKGRIKIADLANAVVEVDIETSTNTAKALQTWFSVPLGRKQTFLGGYLRDIEGTVRAKLDLSISVNERGAKNSVDVKLNFDQAAFKAPAWGVELSGIDGEVRVTEKGVSSEGINAFYFKDPVDFTIGSTAENRQTIVLANGQMDSQKVLNRLPEFLARGFEGRSPWQIRLTIANQQDSQRLPVVQIRATSKLEKTQVSFPEPFSKKAEIQRDFSAELSIFEADDIDFKVDFGSDIKARGRLHPDKRGEYRLVAMDIGFSAPLKEPVPRGLRLYGSMPRLALDGWLEFRKAIVASQPGDSTSLTDLLESADLEVQSVSFFGHNFNDADFLLVRTPLGFAGTLDSSLVKGNYEIPFSYSAENPVTADLEYIKFRTLEPKSESSGVLPTDLFDLQLRSKVFEYNDVLFTDLILNARLEGDTLVIDSMELRRNDLTLKLSANWQYLLGVNEHFTTLQVSIKGKEFGQTIASLDLGDIIYGGEVDIEGRAGWSGELLRVDWGSLIGEARFDVVDGVLKDVEPGSGRLVGLLSLSALPRRLLLDFGDIVVDGLQFDKLAGTFKIDQGNLYTNDTSMNGPSARVNISGRTGLLDRDYDQTMIIVPKIRQTLPVIGSLAWGNAAGWGLLILQKLFKKQIDKSVEIEYKVTGTWDEPVLELIREFEEDKPGKKIEGTDK